MDTQSGIKSSATVILGRKAEMLLCAVLSFLVASLGEGLKSTMAKVELNKSTDVTKQEAKE